MYTNIKIHDMIYCINNILGPGIWNPNIGNFVEAPFSQPRLPNTRPGLGDVVPSHRLRPDQKKESSIPAKSVHVPNIEGPWSQKTLRVWYGF